MGALGRSGRGAQALFRSAGIPDSAVTGWDMEETKGGGPFAELVNHDVFVNCIYLAKPIPPFLTAVRRPPTSIPPPPLAHSSSLPPLLNTWH
jgi:hypothetical protein